MALPLEVMHVHHLSIVLHDDDITTIFFELLAELVVSCWELVKVIVNSPLARVVGDRATPVQRHEKRLRRHDCAFEVIF